MQDAQDRRLMTNYTNIGHRPSGKRMNDLLLTLQMKKIIRLGISMIRLSPDIGLLMAL